MIPFQVLITGINDRIGTILRKALQNIHDVYGLDRVGPFSDRVFSVDVAEYQQVARTELGYKPQDDASTR